MPTGTLTADGTEQTVATLNPGVPGEVYWYVDLENMESSDSVTVRERVDVDGDGTYELFNASTYTDAQSEPVISQSASLLVLSGVPVRITLEQTATGANGYKIFPYAAGVKH